MLDWHSCQICYPLEIKILLYSCISHLSNAINTVKWEIFASSNFRGISRSVSIREN